MIYIILPAYNEEKNIVKIFNDLVKLNINSEVILVDDGSTDETFNTAKKFTDVLNINILKHLENKGYGAALKSGFNSILPRIKNDDIVITLDADYSHPPSLIPQLVSEIENTKSDIVIASRYVKGGKMIGVPLFRRFTTTSARLIFKIFFHIKNLNDYTSGFRAFRGVLLKKSFNTFGENFITESGFTAAGEILLKLLFFSPQTSEVPLLLRYDFKEGKSKMKIFRTIFDYFKLFLKIKKIDKKGFNHT